MNRIGSTAIGGIIESTATSVPNPAPATGNRPIATPSVNPDQRRDAEPQGETLQACGRVGPQHVFAGAPVWFGSQPF